MTAPTFRITTHRKIPKGSSGVTQVGSRSLTALEALDWVLNELPLSAVQIEHGDDTVTIRVRLSELP